MTTSINKITNSDVLIFKSHPTADHYQDIAIKSAIYPGQGSWMGLLYTALKLNGEAGEFAEHVGKAMRDDGLGGRLKFQNGQAMIFEARALTEARREALVKELGDQLWYIAAAAKELGITLSEVMATNLLKLASRTARDTLRGSGDER